MASAPSASGSAERSTAAAALAADSAYATPQRARVSRGSAAKAARERSSILSRIFVARKDGSMMATRSDHAADSRRSASEKASSANFDAA